ncbi:hypothetical protein ACHAWC_003201 [Mediolabrus comicus]
MTKDKSFFADGHPSSPLHHVNYDAINHVYNDSCIVNDGSGTSSQHVNYDAINPLNNDDSRLSSPPSNKEVVSYWSLCQNRNFRWCMLSYLITHIGEWLTYIASISAIEQIHASNSKVSRLSISVLAILRLLPNALFASVGGVLADSYDRRTILFVLDLIGAAIALVYILSYYCESIYGLYFATFLQMTVAAIYVPSRTAIVPMLVAEGEELKKANTILGLAWSTMQALGSSMGGVLTQWVGIQLCFAFDSFTYLVSALFIWKINGRYNPVELDERLIGASSDNESKFSLASFASMTKEGMNYLRSQTWGAFVLLKFSAALIYGASDILNVSFSEQMKNGDLDTEGSSQRLGILFAFVGIGCFLGPLIAEPFTHMDDISSLERACLVSFLIMALGCFGMSQLNHFIGICASTSIRASGSSVVWIYSSLLLQKLSSTSMLGRVSAVDYALATFSEALSALLGGVLQDDVGMSAAQVSLVMALVASATLVIWIIYFARV